MKELLYGFIIGLCKILPGVSGGVVAASLGVYENIINCIYNIKNKNNINYLFKISFGFIIAVILFSKLIYDVLINYYNIIMPILIGIVLYSIKDINKKVNKDYKICYLLIGIIIIVLINYSSTLVKFSNYNFLSIFILGCCEGISIIIPGVSGMALFTILGSYDYVLHSLSLIIYVNKFYSNLAFIIPFMMGIFLTITILIKIINNALQKHYNKFYSFILGVSISSIIFMIIISLKKGCNIIMCFLEIILGIIICMMVNKKIK